VEAQSRLIGSLAEAPTGSGAMVLAEVLKNDATLTVLNANSGNAYVKDTENFNNGYPIFQWVIDNNVTSVVKPVYTGDDNLTITKDYDVLKIRVKQPTQVKVYSITGSLLESLLVADEVTFHLQRGIYIVNGKKVVL
jgi:hypothetical protein